MLDFGTVGHAVAVAVDGGGGYMQTRWPPAGRRARACSLTRSTVSSLMGAGPGCLAAAWWGLARVAVCANRLFIEVCLVFLAARGPSGRSGPWWAGCRARPPGRLRPPAAGPACRAQFRVQTAPSLVGVDRSCSCCGHQPGRPDRAARGPATWCTGIPRPAPVLLARLAPVGL